MEKKHLFDFEGFTLDLKEKTLNRNGEPVSIPPKVFAILEVLIKNEGRIVEKDALIKEVWADSFVEESNLTYSIRQLRKILDDDFHQPKFIETVPRRGYRFIAKIENEISAKKCRTAKGFTKSRKHLPSWAITLKHCDYLI